MERLRRNLYPIDAALVRQESWRARAEHAGADVPYRPPGETFRPLWCRVLEGAPSDPPDERYRVEEVRPAGRDVDGRLLWEPVPGGDPDLIVHNVAEAGPGLHRLAVGTVVRAEKRLDGATPPETICLAHVPVPLWRPGRIVSYAGGAYTVQPVRRGGGGYVDDGAALEAVPNVGELWPDEAGYLEGPADFERYVILHWTDAGWTILLHPPRMV